MKTEVCGYIIGGLLAVILLGAFIVADSGCSQSETFSPPVQTSQPSGCPDGRCPYQEPRETREGWLKV